MRTRAAPFKDFDLRGFWTASKYALKSYVDAPLTAKKVALVERALKVKLPAAYVALMKVQNGGIPAKTNHRTKKSTSWSEDHVAISGILSIGDAKPNSLCGALGSRFMIDEWGYPPIGVYFADCPSAGHDMLCLDYRDCGPKGEPTVVHVDQERDFKITFVAPSFEAFIRGLEGDEVVTETDGIPLRPSPILWRPEAIKASLDPGAGDRWSPRSIKLAQKLRKGEEGWTMMRFEIPASWKIASAKVVNGVVVVARKSGERYRLGPVNVGPLSFAILDGGQKSEAELEAIWVRLTTLRVAQRLPAPARKKAAERSRR